jgi:hypothetical protein
MPWTSVILLCECGPPNATGVRKARWVCDVCGKSWTYNSNDGNWSAMYGIDTSGYVDSYLVKNAEARNGKGA